MFAKCSLPFTLSRCISVWNAFRTCAAVPLNSIKVFPLLTRRPVNPCEFSQFFTACKSASAGPNCCPNCCGVSHAWNFGELGSCCCASNCCSAASCAALLCSSKCILVTGCCSANAPRSFAGCAMRCTFPRSVTSLSFSTEPAIRASGEGVCAATVPARQRFKAAVMTAEITTPATLERLQRQESIISSTPTGNVYCAGSRQSRFPYSNTN